VTDLTLTGLRVVLEVARTGSFSATAERLGYTQSAVSRQVAVAEKAMGMPLFERHARGTRPTPAAEALARHAGKVLDEITAATQYWPACGIAWPAAWPSQASRRPPPYCSLAP
jgi:DNA-binding transcriptional LysR family regulator